MELEKVVVGDWSGDGHCRTDVYYINVPCKFDTAAAYAAAVKETGVDITREFDDYEQASFDIEDWNKIVSAAEKYGLKMPAPEDIDEDEGGEVWLSPVVLFEVWLLMVNIGKMMQSPGSPLIERTVLKFRAVRDIGGYGLYSD